MTETSNNLGINAVANFNDAMVSGMLAKALQAHRVLKIL